MDDLVESGNDPVADKLTDGQDENVLGSMETCKKLVWEYELSRGRWIRYENDINRKFNESIANDVMEFEMDESKLQVDFKSMKQKNLDTGFVRSVRCAVRNDEGIHRVWEYIDLKRRWRSADPLSAITLENAFVNGLGNVKILLSGTKFMADFGSDVVRSDDGLTEYKIRSHISNAEPSMTAKPVPKIERLRAIKRLAAKTDTAENKRKAIRNEDDKNDTNRGNDSSEKQISESKTTRRKANSTCGNQKTNDLNCNVDKGTRSDLKRVVLKGITAVDPECHELINIAHVYAEFNDVYDALLNQVA
ncbi:unnamed protein product [Litomosoides sigmodontis]|uniref:WWE domain-containing protein n=1 Tax=Litomosoides sigmodontis TaxID=42156 RepID=A0A3P6UTS6_LITSI|nr:unnamed protein product [Litomosoides sigmodontis]